MAQNPNRGGKRPGAGRKPSTTRTVMADLRDKILQAEGIKPLEAIVENMRYYWEKAVADAPRPGGDTPDPLFWRQLAEEILTKTGLNVVDVATSAGDGTQCSRGIFIAVQPGARGWSDAIQVGDDNTPGMEPSRFSVLRTGGMWRDGYTLRGLDFKTTAFAVAAIDLRPGINGQSQICWGAGAGGAIWSVTTQRAPVQHFGDSAWAVLDNGGTKQALAVSTAPGAESVAVLFPGIGLRVLIPGPPDSSGPGRRALTIAN